MLLFHIHNLTIHDYDSNHPMKWIEQFYYSPFKGGSNAQKIIGIREGGVAVSKYMASGKDLWEHSPILPTWMKGRSTTKSWINAHTTSADVVTD